MKELIIIAGANGSGKSTIAKKLLSCDSDLGFVNADDIAFNIAPNDFESVRVTAGKLAIKKIYDNIEAGISFAWETTLSGNFAEKIIAKARESGYFVKLVYVFLEDYSDCIDRVRVRVMKGGHNIPDEDIIRRYKRSKTNFFKYRDMVDFWELNNNNGSDLRMIADKNGVLDLGIYNVFVGGLHDEQC